MRRELLLRLLTFALLAFRVFADSSGRFGRSVCLLAYNSRHHKTEQVNCLIKSFGYFTGMLHDDTLLSLQQIPTHKNNVERQST